MKVGDKVVALISEACLDTIIKGKVYTIKQAFMWENYGLVIVLEGQTPDGGWLVNDDGRLYFKKVQDNFTNALTKELAEKGVERSIERIEQPERVFTTEAKF